MPKSRASVHVSKNTSTRKTTTKTTKRTKTTKMTKTPKSNGGQKRCPGCGRFL